MDKEMALLSELTEKDGETEQDEIAAKEAIERLNALYATVCNNAQAVRKMFTDSGIESREGFYNNHAVAVGDGYITEMYPIPVVTAKIKGVAVDIGFDIVTRNGNIGFVEFTVDKDVLIGLDFSKLTEYEFAIYGVEHYLTDYWFGDVAAAKELIQKSDEKQFHIGFEFPDMRVLKKMLETFYIVTSEVGCEVTDVDDNKMLGKK